MMRMLLLTIHQKDVGETGGELDTIGGSQITGILIVLEEEEEDLN